MIRGAWGGGSGNPQASQNDEKVPPNVGNPEILNTFVVSMFFSIPAQFNVVFSLSFAVSLLLVSGNPPIFALNLKYAFGLLFPSSP